MAARRGLGLVVASAGLGALILASPILRDKALLREAPAPQPQTETRAPGEQDDGQGVAEIVAGSSPTPAPVIARPVAPETIAPLEIEHHALERVEAREPLGPIGQVHIPSQGPPKETVLHRPLVTEAGTFQAMGYDIALPGLLPTSETELCGEGEAAWPCGIHARTAFRNWLRGRALACVVPPAPPAETVITPCLLGKFDAGAWLVGQGWARVDPADDRYAALGQKAQMAGRGLYGAGPGALAPFSVTLPPMADQNDPPSEEMQSSGD